MTNGCLFDTAGSMTCHMFLAEFHGENFLFDCLFDETTEDYPADYPGSSPCRSCLIEDLIGPWHELSERALAELGAVPVSVGLRHQQAASRGRRGATEILADFRQRNPGAGRCQPADSLPRRTHFPQKRRQHVPCCLPRRLRHLPAQRLVRHLRPRRHRRRLVVADARRPALGHFRPFRRCRRPPRLRRRCRRSLAVQDLVELLDFRHQDLREVLVPAHLAASRSFAPCSASGQLEPR